METFENNYKANGKGKRINNSGKRQQTKGKKKRIKDKKGKRQKAEKSQCRHLEADHTFLR